MAPTAGLVTSEAGDDAEFTVVLDNAPSDTVTIALSSSDTGEGTTSPSSLTFTPGNWSTAQTVTVTGVDDNTVDGDSAYSIVTAAAISNDGNYAGIDANDVGVTNSDDDTATLAIGDVSLAEDSGVFTFTVTLSGNVAGGFTVPFPTGDLGAVAPDDYASNADVLAFAGIDGETQTIEVSVVADAAYEGDEIFGVTLGAASNPAVSLTDGTAQGTIVDDDHTADIAVSNTPDNVLLEPGQAAIYTVTVRNLDATTTQAAAAIAYTLPAALNGATWICSATDGTGTFDTTLALPPGAEVTFVLSATFSSDARGADRIETLASVSVESPYVDPIGANDTATATAHLRAVFADDFQ